MSYDFDKELDKAEQKYPRTNSGNSDYFNIEEGNDNVLRVLTEGATYATHYMGKGVKSPVCYGHDKGCPARQKDDDGKYSHIHGETSIRFVMFVLDRKDEKVKSAFFPYSVVKQIGALQKNPDYQFSDLPMPYDIRITFKPDNGPADKYRVEFKPNGLDLTDDQKQDLADKIEKMSPEAIVERMKEKAMEEDIKMGRIKTEDDLANEKNAFNKDQSARAKEQAKNTPKEETVVYPDEEINPEDIPF